MALRSTWLVNKSSVNHRPITWCQQAVRTNYTQIYGEHIDTVLKSLQHSLKCTEEKVLGIFDKLPSTRCIEAIPNMEQNIETLRRLGVTSDSIVENAFVLSVDNGKSLR